MRLLPLFRRFFLHLVLLLTMLLKVLPALCKVILLLNYAKYVQDVVEQIAGEAEAIDVYKRQEFK